ncbi:MAG: hypothetical protein ACRDE8_00715, partial [Ginsengibacter sp.]
GEAQSRFSYIINGDINRDGNSSSDLMYIYAKGSDVPFVDFTTTTNGVTTVKYTIAQQQAAYDQLVNNSSYLRKHKGQYAERNSALTPWYNRIDMRFLQDFFITAGGTKHSLQFSVDVLNLPNLLDKNWGIKQYTSLGSATNFIENPLSLKSVDANGNPTFTLAEFNKQLITSSFQKDISTFSTWGMQLGLRYFF